MSVVGRFAPSPTGDLHLGSALAALASWASVRSRGGRFIWRVEDIDGPRAVGGAAKRQIEDARWLGLDWDEGPDVGGPHGPYLQSRRGPVYDGALKRLAGAGHLFPCRLSRRDLREIASAPHGHGGLPPYPTHLRPTDLEAGWLDGLEDEGAALRFVVRPGQVAFEDVVAGAVLEDVSETVGDFVLRRRDGVYGYQLAVVVDDLAMGVTEVVRGMDLLDSTARQILLIRALGGNVPTYAHLPLLVEGDGRKLSKRHGAQTVREFRDAGVSASALVGWLAGALGLEDAPRTPAEAAASFRLGAVRPDPVTVPPGLDRILLDRS